MLNWYYLTGVVVRQHSVDGLHDGEHEQEDGGGGGHAGPGVAEVVVHQHGAVPVPAPAAVLPDVAEQVGVARGGGRPRATRAMARGSAAQFFFVF